MPETIGMTTVADEFLLEAIDAGRELGDAAAMVVASMAIQSLEVDGMPVALPLRELAKKGKSDLVTTITY